MSFIPGPYVSSALICQSSVELLKPGDLTVRGDGEYSRWRCVNYQLLKPQEANPSVWPVCFTSCWPFAVLFFMGVKSVAGKADVFFFWHFGCCFFFDDGSNTCYILCAHSFFFNLLLSSYQFAVATATLYCTYTLTIRLLWHVSVFFLFCHLSSLFHLISTSGG